MAAGDQEMEGSSFLLDSTVSNQSGDVLSLEDLAWADSCFVKDPEISDTNWDSLNRPSLTARTVTYSKIKSTSLTQAFLQMLTSQTDSLEFSAVERDSFLEASDFEILPTVEEAQIPTVDDLVPPNEEVEESGDDYIGEKTDGINSITKFKNPFLPNYSEYPKEIEDTDPGLDPGLDLGFFTVSVTVPSSEDIFKVWDLDSSPAEEEDELIKQLNKALAESSLQPTPSTFDDYGGRKKVESLDDLIAGISDLSLNQNSG